MRESVSIILPCYNEEDYIVDAVRSMKTQTYKPDEVIVVDDGSSDNSLDVATEEWERVQGLKQPNRGAPAARNLGAEYATGDYLIFFDADDMFGVDSTLAGMMRAAERQDNKIIAARWKWLTYSDGQWQEGREIRPGAAPKNDELLGWLLPHGWMYPPSAIMWPRRLYSRVGGWDETLKKDQDGDIVMRALVRGAKIYESDVGYTLYRMGGPRQSNISLQWGREEIASKVRVAERITQALQYRGELHSDYRYAAARRIYDCARRAARKGFKEAECYMGSAEALDRTAITMLDKIRYVVAKTFGGRVEDALSACIPGRIKAWVQRRYVIDNGGDANGEQT